MQSIVIRRIAFALLAVTLAGCGASAPPRQSTGRAEPASSKDGYDFRREGTVPVASGGSARPETDVEEIPIADSTLDVSEAEAPPDTVRAPAGADSTADGFRIQLFASADRDVAQNARAAAEERLNLPAYLDLEGGVYKVRVGDYRSRDDASAALPTVRGQYYPDAWVVPAKIRVPR